MNIGEFLKNYRNSKEMSMDELANRCGISKAYISKLENPINKIKPSLQTFNKIAQGLQIQLNDLLEMLDNSQEISIASDMYSRLNNGILQEIGDLLNELNETGKKEIVKRAKELTYIPEYMLEAPSNNLIKIPLADSSLSAGTGNLLLSDSYELVEINAAKYPDADIAFKVSGDSMMPDYQDGQVVYIHKQPTIRVGEIGAFLYDDEQFIKQLIQVDGKLLLHSLNPKYEDIEIKSELITYGKILS